MSHIDIHIDTNNADFRDGYGGTELARILNELATRVLDWSGEPADWPDNSIPLRDTNGNTVGAMSVTR